LSMLESKMVDAVVCIANGDIDNPLSWSYPKPILARTPEDVLRGRGVKPALAPSLQVLDDIKKDNSIRKLLFCGVGCAVQGMKTMPALRDVLEFIRLHYMRLPDVFRFPRCLQSVPCNTR
jgi:coenzyme F420-reducing hydrogenase beta subunit